MFGFSVSSSIYPSTHPTAAKTQTHEFPCLFFPFALQTPECVWRTLRKLWVPRTISNWKIACTLGETKWTNFANRNKWYLSIYDLLPSSVHREWSKKLKAIYLTFSVVNKKIILFVAPFERGVLFFKKQIEWKKFFK